METKRKQLKDRDNISSVQEVMAKRPALSPGSFISYEDSRSSKDVGSSNFDTSSLVGPVVKLPVDTKIVMRLDNAPAQRPPRKKGPEKDLMNKIDAVSYCKLNTRSQTEYHHIIKYICSVWETDIIKIMA